MSLRVVDDDDAFADRDEEPHGYGVTTEPRRRGPGAPRFWAIVEREGPTPTGEAGPVGGQHVCRTCHQPTPILHAIGDDPRRMYCGGCQGKANRERVGWAKASEPTAEKRR